MQPARDDRAEQERLRSALTAVTDRLQKEADDRVSKRRTVELRWLEDLRQYQGVYDGKTERELADANKSTLFINQTRPKTNACEARLSDMLFPTDEKNWGIEPTPVPELSDAAREALEQAEALTAQANAKVAGDPTGSVATAQKAGHAYGLAEKAKTMVAEAAKRAKGMMHEIDDQLVECNYAIHARDAIRDACKIGTGILKGPVAAQDRVRRAWQQTEDGKHELAFVGVNRPAIYWTDPWGFFPETDAKRIEESESTFERYINTTKELRKLAKQPGFDADAIRRVIKAGPSRELPTYLSELRTIPGEKTVPMDGRYIVWEYRGPLTAEEMRDVCACLGEEDLYDDDDVDPLAEINVVIWFCQGEILKFGIHHLDSGESIYSVYNLEADESSIWGYGIPAIMRDPQRALNAAWRMMMDNAGLASGPQIEIDRSVVEPADGDWSLAPRKIWLRKENAPANKPGFRVENIDSHQPEQQAIIIQCTEVIDAVTNISVLTQGEQGAHTTQTAGGMALLMNAVNVVFRRMVKNFDDDVTVPNIRRMYDWNMQFSEKSEIKGDFEVSARGTSVLLVREIQSQNLLVLAQFTAHPVLGQLLKAAPLMRKLAESMMIKPDEIIVTEDELKRAADQQQERGEEMPPEATARLQAAQIAAKARTDAALIDQETQMMRMAETRNMSLDDIAAKLQDRREERASKERLFAGEAAMTERRDQRRPGASTGGGYL